MVKCFKYVILTLIGLLITSSLVQLPDNKAYAENNPIEYWAVIVGVADYLYLDSPPLLPIYMKDHDLRYSDDDAKDVAAKLSSIWGADHIKLLVDSQATRSGIQNSISDWLDTKEDVNDVVLFYFVGHGRQDGNDDYIILPYNTLVTSDKNDIRDDNLDSWLTCLESSQQVIILDTCNSGGFINELYQYGRVVLASSSKNEDSYEKSLLGHSIFTYYILDAFDHLGKVDENNDNSISIEEIFNWAESKTVASANIQLRTQHPVINDCYYGQIGLVDIVKENRNTIWLYIAGLVIVVTVASTLIVWNRYQSMEKVRENMDKSEDTGS
jgi:hypothetical protein